VEVKLPNGINAVVDVMKLRDYCLSPGHPEGRHKARVFRATLGMEQEDVEELRAAILAERLGTKMPSRPKRTNTGSVMC
jgi:hypothetical protein